MNKLINLGLLSFCALYFHAVFANPPIESPLGSTQAYVATCKIANSENTVPVYIACFPNSGPAGRCYLDHSDPVPVQAAEIVNHYNGDYTIFTKTLADRQNTCLEPGDPTTPDPLVKLESANEQNVATGYQVTGNGVVIYSQPTTMHINF